MMYVHPIAQLLRALIASAALAFLLCAPSGAESLADNTLVKALKGNLASYLDARGKIEHISCASLSIRFPTPQTELDVVSGRTAFTGGSEIIARTMFQIGSNTKSFTAATLLQLEAEGRVSIDDKVGNGCLSIRATPTSRSGVC